MTMQCPACGTDNLDQAKFCKSCGASLPEATVSGQVAGASEEGALPSDGVARPSDGAEQATPAAPEPGATRPSWLRSKQAVVLGVVGAVALVGSCCWSSYGRSVEADRAKAQTAMNDAQRKVQVAEDPGLSGEASVWASEARRALERARREYDTGSIINRDAYEHARKTSAWAGEQAASLQAIRLAESDIQEAAPAVAPKTTEAAEIARAKASVEDAKSAYRSGSRANLDGYSRAREACVDARDQAQVITDRVSGLLSKAQTEMLGGRYTKTCGLCFRLAKRYPRTEEAKEAKTLSEEAILKSVKSASWVRELDSLGWYLRAYPSRTKPGGVLKEARRALLAVAQKHQSDQAGTVSTNRRWVSGIRSKGRVADILTGTAPGDARELKKIRALLPRLYQPRAMRRLFVALDAGCRIGLRLRTLEASPSRERGTTQYYTSGQIARVASLTSDMGAYVSSATRLLKALRK